MIPTCTMIKHKWGKPKVIAISTISRAAQEVDKGKVLAVIEGEQDEDEENKARVEAQVKSRAMV